MRLGPFTFMSHGKRRVERIPKDWVDTCASRVEAGREFHDAVREILTANAELLNFGAPTAAQTATVELASPRGLLRYAAQCLGLEKYLRQLSAMAGRNPGLPLAPCCGRC